MKKTLLLAILLLLGITLGAQQRSMGHLNRGLHGSVGVSAGWSDPTSFLDIAPEAGISYRLDSQNSFGITAQVLLPVYEPEPSIQRQSYYMLNLFLTYTHDFSDVPQTLYMHYKAGLADISSHPGPHLGAEFGYRFLLGNKLPLRIGASLDWNRILFGVHGENRKNAFFAGLVARLEW